jgi:hypothetical protein
VNSNLTNAFGHAVLDGLPAQSSAATLPNVGTFGCNASADAWECGDGGFIIDILRLQVVLAKSLRLDWIDAAALKRQRSGSSVWTEGDLHLGEPF